MTENLDDLRERVDAASAAWAPGSSIGEISTLKGGRSSLTFVAHVDGGPSEHPRIVVKVAPAGLPPVRNRDVLRQARLLRALEAAPGVRVPLVLFDDPGGPPEIPPFFAMSFVEGDCFEPSMDEIDVYPDRADIETRALTAATMLAALHAVRPGDVGLADEPEVDLVEEVERWVRAFATVEDELKPGADEIAEILRATIPKDLPSTLVHGDYRIGNTLCKGPDLNAIVDWEIWARSDPRIDVAWFLLSSNADVHPSATRTDTGVPPPEVLLATYVAAGGAPVDDLEWFKAHALFKVGAVTALLVKNARKRGEAETMFPTALQNVRLMLSSARATLG